MRPVTKAGPSSAQSRKLLRKKITAGFPGKRFSRWRMERANKKNKRKKSSLWFPRLKGKKYPAVPRIFEQDERAVALL
jgi:hypothetical protein